MANMPRITGSRGSPSNSSSRPKVNRCSAVKLSVPMKATAKPSAALIKPFSIDFCVRLTMTQIPIIVMRNISSGPMATAALATTDAPNSMVSEPIIPPKKAPMVESAMARPPWPRFVIG